MKIKKLILQNFRQFRDLEIDFSITKDKNVNIILAENSTGKTTLMQSIKWCLYGDEETNLDNLNELINYDVINNSINEKEELWVELLIVKNNVDYLVRRTKEIHVNSQNKASEQIRLEYKKDDGETIIWEGETNSQQPVVKKIKRMINSILSKEMASYFLFDGERIDSLGKNDSKSRNDIKQAINAINNFTIIDNAISSLNALNRKFRRNISTQSNDKELQKLTSEISELEKLISESTDEVDRLQGKIHYMQSEMDTLDAELSAFDEVESLVKKRTDIERSIKKYDKNLKDINKKLLRQYSLHKFKSSIFKISEKYKEIQFNKDHEQLTIPGMKVSALEHIIESGICICGEKLTSEHITHLSEQKTYQPPQSNTDLINTFKHLVQEQTIGLQNNIDDYNRYKEEHIVISDTLHDFKEELGDLSEKIGSSDTSGVKHKNEMRTQLNSNIREANGDMIVLNHELSRYKNELQRKENEYNQKLKENSEHRINTIKLELIEKSLNALIRRNDRYRQDKKVEIEEIANRHFSEIIYKNKKININSDFEYKVIEENGSVASPSEGERMAISMSLVLAIIEVHKNTVSKKTDDIDISTEQNDFCLVLDAAFAKLDEQFSRKIAEKLPNSVEQIILFSTEKQYSGSVESSMENYIGKKYRLTIPNNDRENSLTNDDLVLLEG